MQSAIDRATTPVGVVVAAFALVGTIVVGAVGFRGEVAEPRELGGAPVDHSTPVAGATR